MEEKQFAPLTDAVFVEDYNKKYAAIEEAEAAALKKSAELDRQRDGDIINITNAMEASKVIIHDKIAATDDECKQRLRDADEKCMAELRACEGRMAAARRVLAKAEQECETRRDKAARESEKFAEEIEKKYKSDTAAEEKRYKDVLKQRDADLKKQADGFAARKAELKVSYDAGVAEIKGKIADLHEYYKTQEEAGVQELNKVKEECSAKIAEKQGEFDAVQAEYAEKLKNCEKQKIRLLKNELALHKNSCESAIAVLKGEIATAQKVYEIKHNDIFTQLVRELTGQQRQLRTLKATYDFDKAEIGYEQRVAEAKNQNRILAEDREHEEKLAEAELDRQDGLNKKYSGDFCGNFDMESMQKKAQRDFDIALEEEDKNMLLAKLALEADNKSIDCDRVIAVAAREAELACDEAKAERDINAEREKCRHAKQILRMDVFSLAFKTANKSEKLLNKRKLERIENGINGRIEKVKQRLADDLEFISTLREYQAAEYDAVKKTTESFYAKQKEALAALIDEAEKEGREKEKAVFARSLADTEANEAAAAESLKEQAKYIDDMTATEENRVREQAQKELAALTLFIKESGDLMEKHNGMSDELTARADEQRKDAVVDLLGIYEGLLADYDGGLEGARADNAKNYDAFAKASVVEKETFLQDTDDRKEREAKNCGARQAEIGDKYTQFVNEAEKNKAISKGMLEEQLNKSFDARQDKKAENAQLVARKANELKSFENACNRAVADVRKECDRKINEYEKLRAKEEKWLLKNGKVDYRKEWWVVDFD